MKTAALNIRMKKATAGVSRSQYYDRSPQDSAWVTLLELPDPYCFNEALLMCEYPDGKWAAWIPDFGEVTLHSGQFCRDRV
ncbi:hypothetical protein V2H45_23325 [Tumidithrix elongata RA019]|uniref:Uncharacterized protein n=2 Tax=Tumidithrix TaxID=3088355 RepID=A0AAW9PWR5_9CYAN|nr:hypothetical protein [Tumidithrix elongata RA019]